MILSISGVAGYLRLSLRSASRFDIHDPPCHAIRGTTPTLPSPLEGGGDKQMCRSGKLSLRRLDQRVLLAFEDLAHRRTLQHAVLPGGVVLEILHRQLDA